HTVGAQKINRRLRQWRTELTRSFVLQNFYQFKTILKFLSFAPKFDPVFGFLLSPYMFVSENALYVFQSRRDGQQGARVGLIAVGLQRERCFASEVFSSSYCWRE